MGCGSSTVVQIETRGLAYIYYGTTSGTSSRLAFQFADLLKQMKFIVKVINLSEFEPGTIISSKLNVFFVSTYSVGQCSNDAMKFNDWISSHERTKDEFQQMNYLIFALGNTQHEKYCQYGINLDNRLTELGAGRLSELGKGNAAENTTEKDYIEWYNNGVEKIIEDQFPLYSYDQERVDLSSFKIKITSEPENLAGQNLEYSAQQYCSSFPFVVKEKKQLKKKPTQGNSTLFFDLQANGLSYQTAANLALYPENSDNDILDICNQLRIDQKKVFQVVSKSKQPFPSPISIYHYLQKFCDFLGPVTRKQLIELSNLIVEKTQKEELIHAASFEGREKFEVQYQNAKLNLLQLLKKYNIRNLNLEQLIEICPHISPRYFTIASSSKKYPNNIHIVASELTLTQNRLGLCSEYFQNLQPGDTIKGYLQASSFAFPRNSKLPVLLIGPGAGLAPMRAMIQEKDYYLEKNQLEACPFQGPMKLYFGCRTHNEILFEDELKNYYKNGTLSDYKIAFSREGNKQYVTDLIDLQQIQDHLALDGIIYICGSSNMGKDITNKIEEMYKELENVAPYMAFKKINELQEKQQLITEFWG